MPFQSHWMQLARSAGQQLRQAITQLACLPYEAAFSLGAIARTLWRMAISRRHLLQWAPSSEVERSLGSGGSRRLCGSVLGPSTLSPTATSRRSPQIPLHPIQSGILRSREYADLAAGDVADCDSHFTGRLALEPVTDRRSL
jgi:hypothetical protein